MPEKELLYNISNDIGTITFNRPQARNALTFEMYDGLAEITDAIIAEPNQLKALIITGAGDKAFAAGTDISRFRDLNTCLLYTSPSPRDKRQSRMPSSA